MPSIIALKAFKKSRVFGAVFLILLLVGLSAALLQPQPVQAQVTCPNSFTLSGVTFSTNSTYSDQTNGISRTVCYYIVEYVRILPCPDVSERSARLGAAMGGRKYIPCTDGIRKNRNIQINFTVNWAPVARNGRFSFTDVRHCSGKSGWSRSVAGENLDPLGPFHSAPDGKGIYYRMFFPDRYLAVHSSAWNKGYVEDDKPEYYGYSPEEVIKFADDLAMQVYDDAWGCPVQLKLGHFHPFEHFKAGTGIQIEPAGELVATMKDENGNPITGRTVFFYAVDEENPGQDQPGMNLKGILRPAPLARADGLPVLKIFNIDERTYWDSAVTDKNGEAKVNYLLQNLIDPEAFAAALLAQTVIHNIGGSNDGKIGGTIRAVTVNPETHAIEKQASFDIEFRHLAQILAITGEGKPDDTTEGSKYSGRVRVKRGVAFPQFDYTPVDEGFLLMPGDIIDIDGNTAVEIAWINGDKAIAQVPGEIKFKDTELPVTHARVLLQSSAFESEFYTGPERLSVKFWGVSIGKGIWFTIKKIPYLGEAVEFGVDVYQRGEYDFGDQSITAKIRVRSEIIIDATGEETKIFNLQGSPEVKTSDGNIVALDDEEMVVVSGESVMSEVVAFDAGEISDRFYEDLPALLSSDTSSGQSSGRTTSSSSEEGGGPFTLIIVLVAIGILAPVLFFGGRRLVKRS